MCEDYPNPYFYSRNLTQKELFFDGADGELLLSPLIDVHVVEIHSAGEPIQQPLLRGTPHKHNPSVGHTCQSESWLCSLYHMSGNAVVLLQEYMNNPPANPVWAQKNNFEKEPSKENRTIK